MRGIVAFEFIGHQPSRFIALAFQETPKEAFRGVFVSSALDKNINRVAVLIDGPQQIVLFTLGRHKHFVKVPGVTEAPLSFFFQHARIIRGEFPAPLTNRFIGDGDITFGEQFFDLTEAEAETMAQSDGMTDNF